MTTAMTGAACYCRRGLRDAVNKTAAGAKKVDSGVCIVAHSRHAMQEPTTGLYLHGANSCKLSNLISMDSAAYWEQCMNLQA